jgi:hypothetical protein
MMKDTVSVQHKGGAASSAPVNTPPSPAGQGALAARPEAARKRGGKARAQTGPTTERGKLRSSRNALKGGLYVGALLHPREAERLTAIREALYHLTAESDVGDHPMAAIVIDTLAMAQVRLARVHAVEAAATAHWFADMSVKGRFCRAVAITSPGVDERVPDWYFEDAGSEAKREAVAIGRALREAQDLAEHQQPPQGLEQSAAWAGLRAFAGEHLSDGRETLAAAITRHFEGPSFAARVRELCSWMKQSFVWELRWAGNPRGFEAAIARLKAEVWGEIYANDARQKLYVSLQRQVAQQLALFEQMRSHAWAPQALST